MELSDALSEHRATFLGNIDQEHYNEARCIRTNATLEQLENLHKIYAPLKFRPNTSDFVKKHIVFSVGRDLCEEYLNTRKTSDTILIGHSFDQLDRELHHCFKISCRDEKRIRERPNLALEDFDYCTRGVGECNVQGRVLIANNVYDISHSELYEAFDNHGTEVAYFAMMLPDEITYDYMSYNKRFGYSIKSSDEDYVMTFNCESFNYRHSKVIWRDWCTHTVFNGEAFSLVFERVQTIGPFTIVQVTRAISPGLVGMNIVTRFDDCVEMFDFLSEPDKFINAITNPYFYWMDKNTEYPANLMHYFRSNFRRVFVPKHIQAKVVQFGLIREDESFRRQSVETFLRATCQKIVVKSTELQSGFDLDIRDFLVVSIHLFLQTAIGRQIETREIGRFIRLLKGQLEGNFPILTHVYTSIREFVMPSGTGFGFSTYGSSNLAKYMMAVQDTPEYTGEIISSSFPLDLEIKFEPYLYPTDEGLCRAQTLGILINGIPGTIARGELQDFDVSCYQIDDSHIRPWIIPDKYCEHGYLISRRRPNVSVVGNAVFDKLQHNIRKRAHPHIIPPKEYYCIGRPLWRGKVHLPHQKDYKRWSSGVFDCSWGTSPYCPDCSRMLPLYIDCESEFSFDYLDHVTTIYLDNFSPKFFTASQLKTIADVPGLYYDGRALTNFDRVSGFSLDVAALFNEVINSFKSQPEPTDSVAVCGSVSLLDYVQLKGLHGETDYQAFSDACNSFMEGADTSAILHALSDTECEQPVEEVSEPEPVAAVDFDENCPACKLVSASAFDDVRIVGNDAHTNQQYTPPEFENTTITLEIDRNTAFRLLTLLLQELNSNSDSRFEELNVEASAVVKSLLESDDLGGVIEIGGFTGVAGSGKSTTARRMYPNHTFITPYNRLTAEYRDRGHRSYTFIKGMTLNLTDVLLDEVFAMSPGVFAFYALKYKRVNIIGDPFQLSNVDELDFYRGLAVKDLFPHDKLPRINVSHTMPLDVTQYLNDEFGYNAKTTSLVAKSMYYRTANMASEQEFFCFLRRTDARYRNATTVAKIQGKRTDVTNLIIEHTANKLIDSVPQQLLVALTRHSKRCYYDTCNLPRNYKGVDMLKYTQHICNLGAYSRRYAREVPYIYDSTIMRDAPREIEITALNELARPKLVQKLVKNDKAQRFVTRTTENEGHKEVTVYRPINTIVSHSRFDADHVDTTLPVEPHHIEQDVDTEKILVNRVSDISAVDQIISKLSPTNLPLNTYYGVQTTRFPHDAHYSVKDPVGLGRDMCNRVTRMDASLRGRPCFASNINQSLHTALERYGEKPERTLTRSQIRQLGWDMYQSITHLLVNIQPVTIEDVSICYAEQIQKINKKGVEVNESYLLDPEQYESFEKISCFLKQQVKADLKPDSWIRLSDDGESFKAGQGISAQSKAVNVLVGSYVRAFEKKLREALHPSVVFGFGFSDEELDSKVRNAKLNGCTGLEVDIEQMDKQRGKVTDIYMRHLYAAFGVPRYVYSLMEGFNQDWSLHAVDFSVEVKEHFQSGRADTLISNTLVNLGYIMSHYKFRGFRFGLFQGDDTAVFAKKIEKVRQCDFLKESKVEFPGFVGYVIADCLLVDTPRLCVKLLNRKYAQGKIDADIKDYRRGVGEWLRVLRCQNDYFKNIHVVSRKYGISTDESQTLLDFLYNYSRGYVVSGEKSKSINTTYLSNFWR